jgi:uncharacterized protein YxeA
MEYYNQNNPQTMPDINPGNKKVGPIIGVIVIVILLIVAALYFWGRDVKDDTSMTADEAALIQEQERAVEADPESARLDAELDAEIEKIDDLSF